MGEFQPGDRVRLIAPFRCSGDSQSSDTRFDKQLRQESDEPTGTVLEDKFGGHDYVYVVWDAPEHLHLWTDPAVLDLADPVSAEDVDAAIRSILERP